MGELEQPPQEKPMNIDTSSLNNGMEDSDVQKSDVCGVDRPMKDGLAESHRDSGLDTFDAQWTLTYRPQWDKTVAISEMARYVNHYANTIIC